MSRTRCALHVLAHVEADELDAERPRELARHLRLADPGRAGEKVGSDGLLRWAEPRSRQLDRGRELADGAVLAEDDAAESLL
jgi:hypothetical protein